MIFHLRNTSLNNSISRILLLTLYMSAFAVPGYSQIPFPSTPLNIKSDFSSLMVEDIDHFLTSETDRVRQNRENLWQRNFSTYEAFNKSIATQRSLLANRLGVVDLRVKPKMEVLDNGELQHFKAETDACVIQPVRWKVLDKLSAEGLLLQPKGKVLARVVMIPDADILPEVFAGLQKTDAPGYGMARRLAEAGCEVLVPVLVNRADTFSGSPLLGLFTNQSHREWIYRQGYEVGRHIIGYELQKIFAAIDWMESRNKIENKNVLIGVAGYGEGGLLALDAAALDTRISSTLVSGYFNAREQVWREPIYHNVFGLLKYFGDAELAVMAWPRVLVIEHSRVPEVSGPPVPSKERSGAAPGRLSTPDFSTAKSEWNRAKAMLPAAESANLKWYANDGSAIKQPFSSAALNGFATGLHINLSKNFSASMRPVEALDWIDVMQRQERTVRNMEQCVQQVLALCERTRNKNFWDLLKGDTTMQKPVKAVFREQFWNQIGHLPTPAMPINPRARLLQKTEKWTSYEVMLDVWPGVFAYGILLVPNDLKAGEKRPVVVCQHGLEGVPMDVITTDPKAENFHYYHGFAARLAERGYVTFAPFNPYRGGDKFRVLQRKANPLGLSLFSIITGQHQRIVEWLGQLSFVDPARIGFYGLSYGGKTAMRVPALVTGYALSICSGDFYEWVRYVASTSENSYMFTKEYEIPEWDLGHTFNYAEMAALIAPRPFMVERGNYDNPKIDQWVSYEFEKVRRHYDFIGLPERCRIEYFNDGHMIHGVGTFEFLDKFLFRKQFHKTK
jgi:dienelactone hydrolase